MAKRKLTSDEKSAARKKVEDALKAKNPDRIVRVFVDDETGADGEPRYRVVVIKEDETGGRGNA